MNERNEQFAPSYMVYVAGKSAPTVFHDSLQTAIGEATRLANKERAEVAVLQVVAVGQPDPQTPLDWFFADNVEVACCGAEAAIRSSLNDGIQPPGAGT